ncbi:hypothetical protein GCM10027589_36210 [Actinocorallia lasiicapitis]
MNTSVRLGGFALGLAAVFGAAFAAGKVIDPADGPKAEEHGGGHAEPAAHGGGYTLGRVDGPAGEFAFRVLGPDGAPVTAYDVQHDKRLHLISVRRDLSGFAHVHPELAADGTWRVASPLSGPGAYRVYADFKPSGGAAQTLNLDVTVPGAATERPLPAPARTTTVDGYTVTLDGALKAGATSRLTLEISRDGRPVTDLDPYLGAYGHLVALRAADLSYLHVHPDGEPGDGKTAPGPGITFHAEVPATGSYRLYLDFQHQGEVRTAEFTATTDGGPAPASPEPTGHTHGHGH